MNSEWKRLYNAVIDSCTTLLQEVDSIQGKETGKSINDLQRKKLEKVYRSLRAKINNDKAEYTYADILLLGSCVNMAQVCNKNMMNKAIKTVDFFDNQIIPCFNEYKQMSEEEAVTCFIEKMNESIT